MSDQTLLALDLAEARNGLARKAFSARELAAAYNDAVAAYNNQCAGRPMPPPPPGPLLCPGMR